jgi:hypothetical protein
MSKTWNRLFSYGYKRTLAEPYSPVALEHIGHRRSSRLLNAVDRWWRPSRIDYFFPSRSTFGRCLRDGNGHRLPAALGRCRLRIGVHDAAAGNAVINGVVLSFHNSAFY